MTRTPRLVDLHVDWPLQYVGGSTLFDPAHYPGVGGRLGQVDGYLGDVSAAFVACNRDAADWAGRPDPWRSLGDLIARVEAEFSGRILARPIDHRRWTAEPAGHLAWAVVGVEGLDPLVRSAADLDRLSGLFDRGVRLFQPTYGAGGVLAGSSAPGDDRGLSDLGRALLDRLSDLAGDGHAGRPIVDLAHLNPRSAGDVLDWFEADGGRSTRLILAYSHGAISHDGFETPRALAPDALRRLRALGGFVGLCVGPPFYESADLLRGDIERAADLPRPGRSGMDGIAVGTDFLGVDRTLPGLGTAAEVVAWIAATFDDRSAEALTSGTGGALIRAATGA